MIPKRKRSSTSLPTSPTVVPKRKRSSASLPTTSPTVVPKRKIKRSSTSLSKSSTVVPKRNRSSTTSTFPWEVFLSFRGDDTRFNFTDHLYSALNRFGIHTFRDDEGLERGETIQPSLLKAIEESKVSVVVFSENYANSKWCLDELVKIMECRREKGQIVLPIFYHVDPSDVRRQTGNFGEAFAGYRNVAEERLQRWRAALTEAGLLSGWHLEQGYESEIINRIVKNVYNMLKPRHLYVPENLVGMDSLLEEMLSLLCMESNDVRMIGIHGLGGIGKTTLAKVIYNQIAHQFEDAIFLEHVAEKARRSDGLFELQKRLLGDTLKERFVGISSIDEGMSLTKKRLCSRKVLLILDDVDCLTQLETLAGNRQWFGVGSRIIITTRDKSLLRTHRAVDVTYVVQGLKYEESFQLFSSLAFLQNFPKKYYLNMSGRVVNYCKGFPLALRVLGSLLRGRTVTKWEIELSKLETKPQIAIQAVLKLSFDRLDRIEKDLFLDVACFFQGEDRDFVLRILDSCNISEVEMRNLQDKSFIRISDNKIKMHDLVQQMGRQIILNESPRDPGSRSRLWNPEDVHDVLGQNLGTEAIEGISFDMSASKEIWLTSEAFKEMKRLRLLRVYWDGLLSYGSNKVRLANNFEFPSYELRYLRWDGWSLDSLPSSFNGEKLVELSLKHSSLKHLWKENQVKYLENLKVMDLSRSPYLVECPDLSGSPSLMTLNLDGCTSLREVHPSIARLKNLKMLNLGNCRMLHHFPRITGLEKLELLNLSGCSRLVKFPDIESNMECLLKLDLEATAIVELPSSVGYLRGLELLSMKDCKNLEILPDRICALESLRTLILSGCSKLGRFPEIKEVMEHLEKLLLDGTSIRELPCSILNLKGLKWLNLRKCKHLRSLPSSICALKSLETLIVSGCSRLNILPEDLGMLKCLRRLRADGTAITKPPVSLVHLTNLEELTFSGCRGSTSNFWFTKPLFFRLWHRENAYSVGLQLPSVSGFLFIKDLDLSDCNLMEGMMDNKLCHLDCLEVLNLSRNNMVSIPADISGLSMLRNLLVRQCEQLQEIPNLPPSIKLLDACDCISIQSLPAPSSMIRQKGPFSSTLLGPVKFMLWNCIGLPQNDALEKFDKSLFPEVGYSIMIPGSRIPKWHWNDESMGASVSADLPPHGLEDNFLGISLCAVFALEEGKTIQHLGEICCNFECREGPYFYHSISWAHSGDRVVETDHVWMMYQPRTQYLKSQSLFADLFKHIRASFSLSGASHVVKRCAIRLIYAPNK